MRASTAAAAPLLPRFRGREGDAHRMPDEEEARGHLGGLQGEGEGGANIGSLRRKMRSVGLRVGQNRVRLLLFLLLVVSLFAVVLAIFRPCEPCAWSRRGEARQALLFEQLRRVDAAFKAAEVPYFVLYGTLIGALRSADILPFTHDVDLLLPPGWKPGKLLRAKHRNESATGSSASSPLPDNVASVTGDVLSSFGERLARDHGLWVLRNCKAGDFECGVCLYRPVPVLLAPFWALVDWVLDVTNGEHMSHVGFYGSWVVGDTASGRGGERIHLHIYADKCPYPFEYFRPWRIGGDPAGADVGGWPNPGESDAGLESPRMVTIRGQEFPAARQAELMNVAYFGEDWLVPAVYGSAGVFKKCMVNPVVNASLAEQS
jgi:hypothetical protein